jgi:hypothetical protein
MYAVRLCAALVVGRAALAPSHVLIENTANRTNSDTCTYGFCVYAVC